MNYKDSQNENKEILIFGQKSFDEEYKIEYNLALLNGAIEYLLAYQEADEKEIYEKEIDRCLKDVYLCITSGKEEISDFVESKQIDELFIDFFSESNFFESHSKYSYGLLECINGIIRNHSDESNSNLSQIFFQQFQTFNPNSINREDEIKYLSLFFDTFRQINHSENLQFFDSNFFEHLLNFMEIDNEIDSQIILIYCQLYMTFPQYPECLIQSTQNILENVSFHMHFDCANLFNVLSKKVPDFLNKFSVIQFFNKVFKKSVSSSQYRTCAILLKSLTLIPYSISCKYIDESVNGFIADSIVKLATVLLDLKQELLENSEFVSIELLNYLLENDGDVYINKFFNSVEDYNLLQHLISILENQAFYFKKISAWTFLNLLKIITQTENKSIFYRFVNNRNFPNHFAVLVASVINIDDIDMKNQLINYILLFFEKVHNLSEEQLFVKEFNDLDIIQNIENDDQLNPESVQLVIKKFSSLIE